MSNNNKYYIFTSEDNPLIEVVDTVLEDYLSENFPGYTFIISENGKYILINEESTKYMVMEYTF